MWVYPGCQQMEMWTAQNVQTKRAWSNCKLFANVCLEYLCHIWSGGFSHLFCFVNCSPPHCTNTRREELLVASCFAAVRLIRHSPKFQYQYQYVRAEGPPQPYPNPISCGPTTAWAKLLVVRKAGHRLQQGRSTSLHQQQQQQQQRSSSSYSSRKHDIRRTKNYITLQRRTRISNKNAETDLDDMICVKWNDIWYSGT